jgi:hypothetical protein
MAELFASSDYGRVVGYYDFVTTPAVRVSGLDPLQTVAHAEHEQAHFTLAHQTTHGHLVIFGSRLLNRGGGGPVLRRRVGELVDDGRDVHERFATYMTLAPNIIYRPLLAHLPERYRRYLDEATELPPTPIRGTRLAKAFLYAAILAVLSPRLPPPGAEDGGEEYFSRCFRVVVGVSKRWRVLARWIDEHADELCADARRIGAASGWDLAEFSATVDGRDPPADAEAERRFVAQMTRHLLVPLGGAGVCTLDDLEREIAPFRRWGGETPMGAALPGVATDDYARLLSMFNERIVPTTRPQTFRNYVVRSSGAVHQTAVVARLRKGGGPLLGVLHSSWPGLDGPVVRWFLHEEEPGGNRRIVHTLLVAALGLNWDVIADGGEPAVVALAAPRTVSSVAPDVQEVVSAARAAGVRVVALFAYNPMLLLEARAFEGSLQYPVRCTGMRLDGPFDIVLWTLGDGMEYAHLVGVSTLLGLTELVTRGLVTFQHLEREGNAWLQELARVLTYVCGEPTESSPI